MVNNYTGDRLNFGLALERAKAKGIKVKFSLFSMAHKLTKNFDFFKIDMILNDDDCAESGRDKTAGRRGLAGLILLLKVRHFKFV